jgi:hypothetical protein
MKFLILASALLLGLQDKGKDRELDTVRYRDFSDLVAEIARDAESADKAHVVWLVDNASMLKASKHGELLAEAIERSFKKAGVGHSVAVLGETPRVALKTGDAGKAAAAVLSLANGAPDDAVKNLLGAVRDAAKLAPAGSGLKKFLVVFTQDNADNEDDVEATAKVLKAAGVALVPVVREAVYSDAYWDKVFSGRIYFPSGGADRYQKLPFKLKGADGAFVEQPYGFPFDWMDPQGSVPSGFAPWAVSRLAQVSGGKVFLYSTDRSSTTFCSRWACPFCAGDHKACDPEFDVTKLKLAEPSWLSRAEVGARIGKDRLAGLVISTWERLWREGVLEAPPTLRPNGSEAPRTEKDPRPTGLQRGGAEWKLVHAQALKAAASADKGSDDLLDAVKKGEKTADRRSLASAEAFAVQLALLSQSFRQLALFCEGMEKAGRVKKAASDGVSSSEFEAADGEKVLSWYWRSYPLCHGGAALKGVKFLGDPKGLHAALDLADRAIEKHAGTPWEILIRRSSIPNFLPIFEQKGEPGAAGGASVRPSAKSSSGQATTETPGSPQRPTRGGAVDPGSRGSGTTTGGSP